MADQLPLDGRLSPIADLTITKRTTPASATLATSMSPPSAAAALGQDEKDSSPSPTLLTIPRVLRDEILKETYKGHIIDVKPDGSCSYDGGITLSCKQLNDEALELYYKHITFRVGTWRGLVSWLGRVHELHNSHVGTIRCRVSMFMAEPFCLYDEEGDEQYCADKDDVEFFSQMLLDKLYRLLELRHLALEEGVCAIDIKSKPIKRTKRERKAEKKAKVLEREA